MKKILLVGQTPPPYGGQFIMIQKTLNANYKNAILYHIRLGLSDDMGEIGKFKFKKIFRLLIAVIKIYWYRLFYHIPILYYFPASPNLIPVIRDIIILLPTRWMFKKVIFHFRAGGLGNYYNQLPILLRYFYRKVYYFPDIAIRLTPFSPDDAKAIKAKHEYIIPNGIDDIAIDYLSGSYQVKDKENSLMIHILYVGVISEVKGVMNLLESCNRLWSKGFRFVIDLVGEFESSEFKNKVSSYIEKNNIKSGVVMHGLCTGDKKWSLYAGADIFCFLSHASYETFGNVLLEAMSFELPIVATNWSGIPYVVDENCAFIVPINDIELIAEKIKILIENPTIRLKMGKNGRKRFLENYTIEKYYEKIDEVFKQL